MLSCVLWQDDGPWNATSFFWPVYLQLEMDSICSTVGGRFRACGMTVWRVIAHRCDAYLLRFRPTDVAIVWDRTGCWLHSVPPQNVKLSAWAYDPNVFIEVRATLNLQLYDRWSTLKIDSFLRCFADNACYDTRIAYRCHTTKILGYVDTSGLDTLTRRTNHDLDTLDPNLPFAQDLYSTHPTQEVCVT